MDTTTNHLTTQPHTQTGTHQWRKALRRNMAVNCSETRFQTSCTAVELPMKVVDICVGRVLGGGGVIRVMD